MFSPIQASREASFGNYLLLVLSLTISSEKVSREGGFGPGVEALFSCTVLC